MADPAQPPLSPFAPHNTPEKSDNPPPPSHPPPPSASIAAHAARRDTVAAGWYVWNGEDLPRGSGGRGGGRGGAGRSAREFQRRDGTGTGQGFWRWFNNPKGANFTQPTSPARVPQPNENNLQDGPLDGVAYRPEAAHHDSDSSSPMTRIMRREQNAATVRRTAVGARVAAMVFSLVAFSVLAADRNKGWALDSYSNYSQFRYCETVNVIGFVYSGFQLYALMHHKKKQKHIIQRPLGDYFDFPMDQVLAYLLISASSSATARVSDWIVNWGTDPFPNMANGSIAVTFLAFLAFAVSSLLSAYNLFSKTF